MKQLFLKAFVLQSFWTRVLATAALIVLGGTMAIAQDPGQNPSQDPNQPAASGQRTDGQIEMDVVHSLDASDALKNDLITAATIQSEVTLSGTVSTQASKSLAESIASHVQGVTKVHNNLNIGNPQDAQDAQATADQSQQAAQQPDDSMAPVPPPVDNAQGNQAPYPSQNPNQYPNNNQVPYPNQGQYPNQQQYPQNGQPYPGQQQGQYPNYPPQQGQYPPPRPGYGYNQPPPPPMPNYRPANGPVTVPPGTLLQLRTSESLDNKRAKDGTPVQFTVIRDVAINGVLAIPKGATVHGVVSESKNAGDLGGSAVLALTLTSLDLGGHSYELASDQFKVKSPNKADRTVGNAIGGGVIGTIIGCAVGRGVGCAVGAGAGVAAGTAASAASPGPRAWIPAEALVTFHLANPVTVDPVDPQEAARLAQGLYQGGPNLYRRGPYGAAYAPYPYGYPPVYYRPYYVVGGAYYWR
jgi:hypothetical protein